MDVRYLRRVGSRDGGSNKCLLVNLTLYAHGSTDVMNSSYKMVEGQEKEFFEVFLSSIQDVLVRCLHPCSQLLIII